MRWKWQHNEESQDVWGKLIARSAKTRSNADRCHGHDGLTASVKELFSVVPRQRCLAHKQYNVLNALAGRVLGGIQVELVDIRNQDIEIGLESVPSEGPPHEFEITPKNTQ